MISELETLRADGLPDQAVAAAVRFIADPNSSGPPALTISVAPYLAHRVGSAFAEKLPWNENTRLLLGFFMRLTAGPNSAPNPYHEFLVGTIRSLMAKDSKTLTNIAAGLTGEIEAHHPDLGGLVSHYLKWSSSGDDWTLGERPTEEIPFQRAAANLLYRQVTGSRSIDPEALCNHSGLFAGLATFQPTLTREWCMNSSTLRNYSVSGCWGSIIDHSGDYDSLCLAYCAAIAQTRADVALTVMSHLNTRREHRYLADLLEVVTHPRASLRSDGLKLLLEHRERDVIEIMTSAFAEVDAAKFVGGINGTEYRRLFEMTVERWKQGGEVLLISILGRVNTNRLSLLLADQLRVLGPAQYPALRQAVHVALEKSDARDQAGLWTAVAEHHPLAFESDFEILLYGKSKPLREIAAGALARMRGKAALAEAHGSLDSKKADVRMGATALIERIGDSSSIPPLRLALEQESSEKVRQVFHQALKACGGSEVATSKSVTAISLEDLIASQSKHLKLPKSTWFDFTKLPSLPKPDGVPLPGQAVKLLISNQSKHKTLDTAPDNLPLLTHIDREKSAPFAAALVEGFLNSDQAASDRWALALGGLLGDSRIIPPLLSRINDWCENSRHKLAEYAAQAISLLPGNEPLMVLDTLSNRYRSKFKNVGKACGEAFNAAATARGITTDELGDLVVPDFGFDAEGIRRFDWSGGGASAELGGDFKLTWFDPETDKAWKALPASAPEEIKTEVKTLAKLLREAVKGQTSRLEMTLVRQRRWPVARWRELFENHPLLRSFASSLVWGVYDSTGNLLRTFRRYPNGLLADAVGGLEELPESDTIVGMVHPLELEAASLEAWRAHLTRFKVKVPFPQIDRPVELLDPLHGNRRAITLTNKKSVSAGTFRSRAEKRGWNRGSVVDAGGISSYYKLYPGAGVEVILPTENFWVGCDPMETIELCPAYFVKAESVERGSYVYNEPGPDDPRVMRFDAVPTVVWSETISDLKAIVATKE